jgi:hypothetical protein
VLTAVSLIGPPEELDQSVGLSDELTLVHLSDVKIYEQTQPVSRVWLPTEVSVVASDQDALEAMRAPGFDGRRRAVVLSSDWDPAWPPRAVGDARAELVSYEPERVEIAVLADSPRLLVVTDSWYPGWQAEVSGTPARLVRVDHAFRGVVVPGGESRIVMSYRPPLLPLGAGISGLALLGAAALLLLPRSRRRAVLE